MTRIGLFFLTLCLLSSAVIGNYQYCCHYCRGDPLSWIDVVSTFRLTPDNDVTRMLATPAFMVNDVMSRTFQVDTRSYELRYGGAPMRIKHQTLAASADILSDQYIQYDLTLPNPINGILAQGGFYEETVQNLIPRKESWTTKYLLSFSNDSSANFQYLRDGKGNIQVLHGPTSFSVPNLESFAEPPVAQFLRVHPLEARTSDGPATDVSLRATPVVCGRKPCVTPKINCLMSPWSSWSECSCKGGSCRQSRDRKFLRLQACGGAPCDNAQEQQGCTPSQPIWMPVLQYLGIALLGIIVIAVAAFLIKRQTGRNNRVEIVHVRGNDDDDDDDDDDVDDAMYPFGAPAMVPPPFMAPPVGDGGYGGAPPTYSASQRFNAGGGMGGVAPLDNENTFMG